MGHPIRRSFPFLPTAVVAAALAIAGLLLSTGPAATAPLATANGLAGAATTAAAAPADAHPVEPGSRTAVATAAGCWTAAPGSHFTFRLVDHVEISLHSPEGGAQQGGVLHAECTVQTLVLDRRAGETLVQQQVEDLRFLAADGREIADDPTCRSFAAAVVAPVLVRIDEVGGIVGYGFAEGLDGDQRNFLRGTLALFAFEAPAAGVDRWTSATCDTTGDYTARYERLGAAEPARLGVRRTRERYTKVIGQPEVPQHELGGSAEAHFATDRGWLEQVRLDERMTMALSLLDLRAITARRASVDFVQASRRSLPAEVAALWTRTTAPATGADELLGIRAADNERRAWQERLRGVTLEQLLAEVESLFAVATVDAEALDGRFQQLQWLLKLEPRAIAALAEQLTTKQLGEATARVALGALGAAGTAEAQEALATVRSDLGLGVELRQAATVACLQLGTPSPAILTGLLQEARNGAELRGTSLLVFGALSPRADGVDADGRTPLQSLLAMEGEATARGELDTWMLAVANADAPATEGIAQRLLGHATAAVRAAACVALGRVPTATALQALLVQGLGDAEPHVRHEAVLALSRRAEPAARTAVQSVAQNDVDQGVRERAQRLLGGA